MTCSSVNVVHVAQNEIQVKLISAYSSLILNFLCLLILIIHDPQDHFSLEGNSSSWSYW